MSVLDNIYSCGRKRQFMVTCSRWNQKALSLLVYSTHYDDVNEAVSEAKVQQGIDAKAIVMPYGASTLPSVIS